MSHTLLLTGFEPYGGRRLNPAAELVARLHGTAVGEGPLRATVTGHTLPVRLHGLRETLAELLDRHRPLALLSLGLAPGTPTLRLERIALNLADFAIPDNAGRTCRDRPLCADGPTALPTTLPVRAIQRAMLDRGLPARLSDNAGAYLCNAVFYQALSVLRQRGLSDRVPCGFIHLPYLPAQVAALIDDGAFGGADEVGASAASMPLDTQLEAVRTAIAVILAHLEEQHHEPT